MISREVADEFADLVRQALQERFKDDLVFDPIVVEPAIDHYGDEYLDIFVVYQGEYKKLDTCWTLGLPAILDWRLVELRVCNVPVISYVEKKEWQKVFKGKHPKASELVSTVNAKTVAK